MRGLVGFGSLQPTQSYETLQYSSAPFSHLPPSFLYSPPSLSHLPPSFPRKRESTALHHENPLRLYPCEQTPRNPLHRSNIEPRPKSLAAQERPRRRLLEALRCSQAGLVRGSRVYGNRHSQGEGYQEVETSMEGGVDRRGQSELAGPV